MIKLAWRLFARRRVKIMTVSEYIFTHITETTRISDGKDPDLVILPKPYTVPSMKDSFQEMYYWDTYFTNKGLILTGNMQQAINNLENFAFLIEKNAWFIKEGLISGGFNEEKIRIKSTFCDAWEEIKKMGDSNNQIILIENDLPNIYLK